MHKTAKLIETVLDEAARVERRFIAASVSLKNDYFFKKIRKNSRFILYPEFVHKILDTKFWKKFWAQKLSGQKL